MTTTTYNLLDDLVRAQPIARMVCPHKPLKIGDYFVQGGSCINPKPGYDIYIGHETSMAYGMAYPWNGGAEVLYYIPNMGVPGDPHSYSRLIDWVGNRLPEGKKVHLGCIGGHGRTGMTLAALAAAFGVKDAIQYVRAYYCHKAVETQKQVAFLVKNFGVSPAPPTMKPITRLTKDRK